MAQFDIYRNTNPATKEIYPYLLDVQSCLLENLDSRLVIPLILKSKLENKILTNLTPSIHIHGKEYLVLTPQMAAINKKILGDKVINCSSDRNSIISSIDFLITGF